MILLASDARPPLNIPFQSNLGKPESIQILYCVDYRWHFQKSLSLTNVVVKIRSEVLVKFMIHLSNPFKFLGEKQKMESKHRVEKVTFNHTYFGYTPSLRAL